MKLRIRGNSIRLRLTRSELEQIAADGAVEDSIQFSSADRLRYRLEAVDQTVLGADFQDGEIRVRVPAARVARWAASDEVSIKGEQALTQAQQLEILVEKDFECLRPRAGEDSSDLFVNPAKAGD